MRILTRQFTLVVSGMLWGLFPVITQAEAKPELFVSVRPLRMILEPIVGARFSVREVLPNGASPHTYDPRPSDLRRATQGRGFFFVGPTLDAWALKLEAPRKVEVLRLLPASARQEFFDPHHGITPSTDPHFWTDPLTVKEVVSPLVKELCAIDAAGCAEFEAAGKKFSLELDRLHDAALKRLAPYKQHPVLLFHPSFLYFMKRYSIQLAGIIEVAPGKEPSPRELKRLIEQVRGLKARAVFSEPQFSKRPAEVIAESTGIRVAELEPYGRRADQSYVDYLRETIEAFAEALK